MTSSPTSAIGSRGLSDALLGEGFVCLCYRIGLALRCALGESIDYWQGDWTGLEDDMVLEVKTRWVRFPRLNNFALFE